MGPGIFGTSKTAADWGGRAVVGASPLILPSVGSEAAVTSVLDGLTLRALSPQGARAEPGALSAPALSFPSRKRSRENPQGVLDVCQPGGFGSPWEPSVLIRVADTGFSSSSLWAAKGNSLLMGDIPNPGSGCCGNPDGARMGSSPAGAARLPIPYILNLKSSRGTMGGAKLLLLRLTPLGGTVLLLWGSLG